MKEQIKYFDTIRFFAITWIFVVHFANAFYPRFFEYCNVGISSFFLNGVTGKFATAVLAVILGFFAFKKGGAEDDFLGYLFKRYIAFFLMDLCISSLMILVGTTMNHSYADALISSLKLGDDIFLTFWCMKAFFFGSLISYFNGNKNVPYYVIIFEIALLYFIGCTWESICLMGNLLYLVINTSSNLLNKIKRNPMIQLLTFIVVFFVIKRPESLLTYFIDGICSFLLIVIVSSNNLICHLFSNKITSTLGKQCMGVFLLHVLTYSSIGTALFGILGENLSFKYCFILAFLVCFIVAYIFSYPLMFFINKTSLVISSFVMKTIRDICINCRRAS